ncbi:MAG: hypothetical protein IJO70_05490 [Lachnospiraceae bacterium]|nr:hypothetical protein [Lachnospiraceae bacterium]
MEEKELEKYKTIKKVGNTLGKILLAIAIFIILGIVALFAMVYISDNLGPGNVESVEKDYRTSQLYSKEDMDEAIEVIKEEYKKEVHFEGCTMNKVVYDGDEISTRELDYIKKRNPEYKECILFKTYSTRNKLKCFFDGWPEEEMFIFWLGREDGGNWEIVTSGTGY